MATTSAGYFAAWLAERVNAGHAVLAQGDGWAVVEYRPGYSLGREMVYEESPTSVRVEPLGLVRSIRLALGRL